MKEEKIFYLVKNIDDDLICEMLEYSPTDNVNGEICEAEPIIIPAIPDRVKGRSFRYPAAALVCLLAVGGAIFAFNFGKIISNDMNTSAESDGAIISADTTATKEAESNSPFLIGLNGNLDSISGMPILFSPTDPSEITHDNPRTDYTVEEASQLIGKMPNLTASSKLHIFAPKSIDHVSAFYRSHTDPLPFEEGLGNFISTFAYLFPGHEFDADCLFYSDGSSDIENNKYFNKVKDKYIELANGEEEMMFFIYSEQFSGKENKVNFVARSPFGNDISIVNKGEANRVAAGRDTALANELFVVADYFQYVKSCSPDSEEKVKLLDGEISVKDAVKFYEDYINNIPCAIKQSFTISVNKVDIHQVSDDLYCLSFITSPEYDGIPFAGTESYASGKIKARYNLDLGYGHMIRTDDVDGFYGTFKTYTAIDEVQYKDHVSLERALEIVSSKMSQPIKINTDSVFKVDSIQLVYVFDNNVGSGGFSESRYPVSPAWKIELYSKSDGLEYTCYVNALTESFEYLV